MRTTKTRQEDYIGLYTRYEIKVKVTIKKILGGRDAIALVCIFRCWPIEIGPSRYKLMHWSWSSFLFARSIPAGGRHTCKPYSHLISDCQLASVQARNQVGHWRPCPRQMPVSPVRNDPPKIDAFTHRYWSQTVRRLWFIHLYVYYNIPPDMLCYY